MDEFDDPHDCLCNGQKNLLGYALMKAREKIKSNREKFSEAELRAIYAPQDVSKPLEREANKKPILMNKTTLSRPTIDEETPSGDDQAN